MATYLRREEGSSVSHSVIARVWKENDLQPWRQGTLKLSRDPKFAEKVIDIVGLYLDPPDGAVVLSADKKTQVQAWSGRKGCGWKEVGDGRWRLIRVR
jgi:hypothetical protein